MTVLRTSPKLIGLEIVAYSTISIPVETSTGLVLRILVGNHCPLGHLDCQQRKAISNRCFRGHRRQNEGVVVVVVGLRLGHMSSPSEPGGFSRFDFQPPNGMEAAKWEQLCNRQPLGVWCIIASAFGGVGQCKGKYKVMDLIFCFLD